MPMGGLETLSYALGVSIVLMIAIFLLSRFFLLSGVWPLAQAFSLNGPNMPLLYLLVFPGTVVHELSHYLACRFTAVRVMEVRLFSPQSNGTMGWVKSAQADPVRRTIVALAPFLGGSLAIYALVRFGLPQSEIDPLAIAPNNLAEGIRLCFTSITIALRQADLHQLSAWLVLYVLFSLSYAVAPSEQDLAPLAGYGLVALALVVAIRAADQQYGWGLADNATLDRVAVYLTGVFERFNALLLFAATVVGIGTAVVVPIASVVLWLRRAASGG